MTKTDNSNQITSISKIKAILSRAGLKLQKRFGQNYLVNASVAERLAKTAKVGKTDKIIEPGAGIGAVTFHLSPLCGHIHAIEIDKKAAGILRELVAGFEIANITVIEDDILKVSASQLGLEHFGYKVVGSLPYDLAKKIIRKYLEVEESKPSTISVIIQKEVAKEYVSKPPKGTFLNQFANIYAEVKYIQTVTKRAFYPIPPVDGAILQFNLRDETLVPAKDITKYRRFLKGCFAKKRQTLLNSISGMYRLEKDQVRDNLRKANLHDLSRPQELTTQEWVNLWNNLEKTRK